MGRARRKGVTSVIRTPYREPHLREIDALCEGRDPITEEQIVPGDTILFDKNDRRAYRRDNPFAHVGAEGKYLWHLWKDDTDIDPVGLASTWKILRNRGQTPGDILRHKESLLRELHLWQETQLATLSPEERREAKEKGSVGRIPSVEMLQTVLAGREDLRRELEGVLRLGNLRFQNLGRHGPVENRGWSEDLHRCVQEINSLLSHNWTPNFWDRGARSFPSLWGMTTSGHRAFPTYRRLERMGEAPL